MSLFQIKRYWNLSRASESPLCQLFWKEGFQNLCAKGLTCIMEDTQQLLGLCSSSTPTSLLAKKIRIKIKYNHTKHTRIKVGSITTYGFEHISWPQTRWANSLSEVHLKQVVSSDETLAIICFGTGLQKQSGMTEVFDKVQIATSSKFSFSITTIFNTNHFQHHNVIIRST